MAHEEDSGSRHSEPPLQVELVGEIEELKEKLDMAHEEDSGSRHSEPPEHTTEGREKNPNPHHRSLTKSPAHAPSTSLSISDRIVPASNSEFEKNRPEMDPKENSAVTRKVMRSQDRSFQILLRIAFAVCLGSNAVYWYFLLRMIIWGKYLDTGDKVMGHADKVLDVFFGVSCVIGTLIVLLCIIYVEISVLATYHPHITFIYQIPSALYQALQSAFHRLIGGRSGSSHPHLD